jgi:hypothetical protein
MAANYRAAGRSRSKAEFIAKMGVVVEEADETVFWLEMLVDSGLVSATKLKNLQTEANELLAVFAASRGTARGWGLRDTAVLLMTRDVGDVVRSRRCPYYFSAFAINADTSFFNSPNDESWMYIMCPAP